MTTNEIVLIVQAVGLGVCAKIWGWSGLVGGIVGIVAFQIWR